MKLLGWGLPTWSWKFFQVRQSAGVTVLTVSTESPEKLIALLPNDNLPWLWEQNPQDPTTGTEAKKKVSREFL